MKRILSALLVLLFFEVGVLLLLIPWTSLWTKNYLVSHSLWVAELVNNYFLRGAVSGIGLADIWMAVYELWRLRRRA